MESSKITGIIDQERIIYDKVISNLQEKGLVEPGQERYLTDAGKQFMTQLVEGYQPVEDESGLETMVEIIKYRQHIGVEWSEADSFIFTAANIFYQWGESIHRDHIADTEKVKDLPLRGIYLMAGMDLLEEAVKFGYLNLGSDQPNKQLDRE